MRDTYIPHPQLNSSENPKIIFGEISQGIHVKLHCLLSYSLTVGEIALLCLQTVNIKGIINVNLACYRNETTDELRYSKKNKASKYLISLTTLLTLTLCWLVEPEKAGGRLTLAPREWDQQRLMKCEVTEANTGGRGRGSRVAIMTREEQWFSITRVYEGGMGISTQIK